VASAPETEVTSPDQHKPGPARLARLGAWVSIVLLLLLLIGNHEGRTEDLFVIGSAGVLAAILLADYAMRKNGIKR